MSKPRKLFDFHYAFADGSYERIRHHTPGDARAGLKKRRGGKLPKVVYKRREPAGCGPQAPVCRREIDLKRVTHIVPKPEPVSFRDFTLSLIKRIGQALGL